ncbi:uncharacterized protein AMSG_11498, partial [Thecamonas trahens ATCC 50062]
MSLLRNEAVTNGRCRWRPPTTLPQWRLAPLLCHAEDDLITLLSSGAVAAESYEGVERIAVSLHQIFGLLAQAVTKDGGAKLEAYDPAAVEVHVVFRLAHWVLDALPSLPVAEVERTGLPL